MNLRNSRVSLYVALCILLHIVISQNADATQISPIIQNPANGHFYILITTEDNSWLSAEAEAISLGGHLVAINDANEQVWVFSQFGNYNGIDRYLWIGLSDKDQEGGFTWSNGDPVTYTNWRSGEPSASTSDEDYVHMWSPASGADAGKWNDNVVSKSGYNFAGVVEIDNFILTSAVYSGNGHRYYLITIPDNSWQTAENIAVAMGGHLAAINDAAEQAWIYSQFGNFGGIDRYLWIGLTDKDQEGVFKWTNGDPVTYTNWGPGEPNGGTSDQDFVYIWSPASGSVAGKWDDHDTSVPGYSFLGVVEVNNTTTTPNPTPNIALIQKYLGKYFKLQRDLKKAKHIQNDNRRKRTIQKIKRKLSKLKKQISAAKNG